MPTCSQAKILTNLESGISKRNFKANTQETFKDENYYESRSNGNNYYNLTSDTYAYDNDQRNHPFSNENPRTVQNLTKKLSSQNCPPIYRADTTQNINTLYDNYDRCSNRLKNFNSNTNFLRSRHNTRRISVDELQMNNYEPNQKKILHKIPIIFNENLGRVPQNQLKMNSYRNNHNLNPHHQKLNVFRSSLKPGSDGEEEDLSNCSEDYNSSDKDSSDYCLSARRALNYLQKRPTVRRSIDCGQLKKIGPEDTKLYLAAKSQEIVRRNSLLNQNQNILSTQFPKIALEVESIDDDAQNLDEHAKDFLNSKSNNTFKSMIKLDAKREIHSLNAKRLLALASIRPSATFHKTMTPEEIFVLKKYYEILKPKIPQHPEVCEEPEAQPTLIYDTTKINYSSLRNLKTFIDSHKKEIDSGNTIIEYDVNNDGAPAGFVLKKQSDESVTKFPAEINDAFLALSVMNETSDKAETKLGEANLYRVLNWNDTSALCTTMMNKKPNVKNIKNSSSTLQSSATASQTSTSSSQNNPAENSFELIKNLSSLVSTVVPQKLSKQLKTTSIDISLLPGGHNEEIPSFEELGINLPHLIADSPRASSGHPTNTHGNSTQHHSESNQLPTVEYHNSKLKVTAYKNLKEKVSSTKTMYFNGPPDRKPMSVIFEYDGDEFGHEKIIDEVTKTLKPIGGHVVSLEFVPRSVHYGSVYVDNQWILTLNSQNTKFFAITNGIKIDDEQINVQSYDEFIFTEFERFIRVEKYKQLIKNHEKAVLVASKKYSK